MKTAAVYRMLIRYCTIALAAAGGVLGASFGTVNLPATLADPATTVQRAATSTPRLTQWCEGPAVAQNGTLYFSEQTQGNIWKVSTSGIMTKLVNIGAYSNGIEFNPLNGRMVVCERSQIAERDTASGAVLRVLVQDNAAVWTAGGSGGANDLSFASNGDLFYTSWNSRIYFRSHDGSVTREWNFPSAVYGTCQWNGIEYIEEKGIVYVAQYGKNRVVTFRVDPATHLIDTGSMKQFGPTIYAPDGITVDANYNVYVCSNNGAAQNPYPHSVVVLDSAGTVIGSIRMSQSMASAAVNCVFGTSMFGGGPNSRTLYVTGDSGAFKVSLKVGGRVWPSASAIGLHGGRTQRTGVCGVSIRRSQSALRIAAAMGSDVSVDIFSVSGRSLGTVRVNPQRTAHWVPPSAGTFIFRASPGAAAVTTTVIHD